MNLSELILWSLLLGIMGMTGAGFILKRSIPNLASCDPKSLELKSCRLRRNKN